MTRCSAFAEPETETRELLWTDDLPRSGVAAALGLTREATESNSFPLRKTRVYHGRMSPPSPAAQIARSLAKYTPQIQAEARAARRILRGLLPTATEMVYDNYNALVFAFVPGDRPSEAILSIALYPRWVTLFFLRGAS
jgi:hypothetical protein